MSNNLPALATSQLPAHLVAAMKQPSAVMSAALTGMSSGTALRLVANQGRFRIKDGGSETVLPDLFLDVVVVGALPGTTKSFYAKAYSPKDDAEQKRPDCASLMGDVPDADSPNKQFDNCAGCPQNQWGSKISPAGEEIKACTDYRRVVVIAVDDPETLYQANIPPASINKFWKKYLKELSMRGVDITMVKTRISLDEHKWVFQFAGYLDAEQYEAVKAIPPAAINDVLGMLGRPVAAPALPAPAAAPAAAPAPEPTPEPAAAPAPAPEAPARGFGRKKAATAPAAASTATVATPPVTVASGNSALDALSNELGALINGGHDV